MKRRLIKIIPKKFYLDREGRLVRILRINVKENRVVLFLYDTSEEIFKEYDTIHYFLAEPVFTIGEASKALQRKPDTLRKYERTQLISPAKRYTASRTGKTIRFYTESDILELADFFSCRGATGPKTKKTNSKIDRNELTKRLKARSDWKF